MEEEKHKKKASLISVIIIFLVIILITILITKKYVNCSDETEALNLVDTENKNYITNKKVEINSYIASLKELYGINVIYGENSLNYANKVDAIVEDDLNIVNNNLKVLFHTLEKYPRGMFEMFRNKEYKMDIIILDKFTNNNIALASKNNLKEIKLYISNTDKFERAIHHELFHIFEYYMQDKSFSVYNGWEELNPSKFNYESDISKLDSKYVYEKDNDLNNSYFLTKYAKSSQKEDRAETFAEIMMLQKEPDYLIQDTNINKKVTKLMGEMSKFLNTKNIYCDKFMK